MCKIASNVVDRNATYANLLKIGPKQHCTTGELFKPKDYKILVFNHIWDNIHMFKVYLSNQPRKTRNNTATIYLFFRIKEFSRLADGEKVKQDKGLLIIRVMLTYIEIN